MFGMQSWMDAWSTVPLAFPWFVVAISCASFLLISRISGWSLLARRFRATEPFCGDTWGWQSARFRGWFGYNHCLTIGASQEGLYLSVMLPFRLLHPALLIPWREIEVETGKMFGWYDTAQFRIGTEERITVKIYGKLVQQVRQAAGPGWPLYHAEQMEGQTRF